ncbi:Guanylyl cyclase GC-E [Hypsibius exemplaris]|uniref:Guanylate cyclase n=1 Tax=Hypsibius exemplaris TaxID=2072580 RepID=A0A1W0WU57_HYPEX|nr:Guanylyl cyclase GC-E [Hypsibius exemplaris]
MQQQGRILTRTRALGLLGVLVVGVLLTERGHASSVPADGGVRPGVLVISTRCEPASEQLLREIMLRADFNLTLTRLDFNFTYTEAPCEEDAEYEAILRMEFLPAYRVYFLIVSFPSSCVALSMWQRRIRHASVVMVAGCEEITWESSSLRSQTQSVIIQLTTPSSYPALIFQNLAAAKSQATAAPRRWNVAATRSCSSTINRMLRYDTAFIQNYYDLLSGDETRIEPSHSHNVFICLSMRDLDVDGFHVATSDSIYLFVQDESSVALIAANLTKAQNVIQINSSHNMDITGLVTYVSDQNSSSDVSLKQAVTRGFSLLVHGLLQQGLGAGFKNSFWIDSSSTLSSRVLMDLTKLNQSSPNSQIIRLSDNLFAYLPDWQVTRLRCPYNATCISGQSHYTVRAEPRDPNSSSIPRSGNTIFGFRFIVLQNTSVGETGMLPAEDIASILAVYIPVGICSFVLVVGLLVMAAYSRQRHLKAHLTRDRTKFFIENDDLIPISKRTNTVQSVNSANASKSTNGFLSNGNGPTANGNSNGGVYGAHDTTKSQASVRTADSYGEKAMGLSAGDNYAKFNGDVVFLRYIRTKHIQLKASTRQLIGNMRDLRGDNINAFVAFFIGASTPSFRPPAVVFEYSSRGSLMDLIDKEEIKLDWSFKVSFLTDLIRGLKAIQHSPIKFHGRLTSRKCVIDNRWTLKITDYAINRLEIMQNGGKSVENLTDEQLLWTAPEVLRNSTVLRDGSAKGDVYSFAIIMQELILRGRPFCTGDLTAKEIIAKIRHPPPLLRPHVSNQTAQPEAITIMKECWTENPEIRPTVDEVVAKFKTLNQGRKVNIVDSMFVMLEKYSNNLEELIHERTEELNDEKRKTEQLLYRMMPQTVAEKLKLGQPVEPESFAEVTIYFSDIVGFTTISAHSTPMEIVNLLNDLYSLFDTTLSYYDVYKVETIGDAYMVVSGLPVANGNKHAGEIASVALELLYQCGRFKIRHLFDVPLMLRIGIHTGSCAAGVVGLTMPRYCLFGDTVNTASRMESTSRAYRIHVSETSHRKLTDLGGYKMTLRGITQVKGKGDMQTFWLEGKTGFNKPLPEPAPDNGENHGLADELITRGRELQKQHDLDGSAAPLRRNGVIAQQSVDDPTPWDK